ncbi:protein-methionine-sulfoxide reductase catalytic subunit MsrP [Methylobacterium oxalidis]|uniref:Protein-methionine-sulfoxide reductase catalytic subunit MsrP n=1 Tax=Methylobacterium oxalidis TaxID=944322 RepID=A0A512J3U0_9HYPH|nr:protein-methionine-sulfoxide reductase catalytic subunit MsrP [Methylobacterium oxalidis]GEP04611.1 mononuclear molybdenum enzyme YedY [Methylobacterium oxalidis]GJE30975.1 Protein-methionine-sulfoxide reductase catalytic subunit MsrP [Methylobacterium oxalidis]GLS62701.1 mononuclear molybdenum enzyme YedY [Methylobacterium oxalidis]
MHIKRRRGWEIPENLATPEAVFLSRRSLLGGAAGLAAASAFGRSAAQAEDALYPAKRNEAYTLDRAVTAERYSGDYNNFYEFGTSKTVLPAANALKTNPWTIRIDGLVEKPFEIDVEDLVRKTGLEERLYRHRCVEAWSMAVAWTGFPLAKLVALAKPTSGAKYVQFQTFMDKAVAPGQRQFFYPWPYVEGLTMAEANNDLAFMVTGIYGKPLPNQFGAPIRLAVPWKYGFKSAKSLVKVSFVAERPKTFWEGLQSSEYGFWANVNPAVPHPRWSQASERVLGTDQRVPTLIYNGYGEQVASLYTGLEKERLFV